MNGLNRLGKVITKILEIFHWVAAGLMAVASVCAAAAPDWVGHIVSFEAKDCCGADLEVYGFDITAPVENGGVDMTTFFLFGIGATVILAVMAMIFCKLHLIFKRTEGSTPFQRENVRTMREIAFLAIAVPAIGFIMSVIIRLVTGVETAEIGIDMSGILTGVIILCLTQFFAYGVKLEGDVDGLL